MTHFNPFHKLFGHLLFLELIIHRKFVKNIPIPCGDTSSVAINNTTRARICQRNEKKTNYNNKPYGRFTTEHMKFKM